MVIKKIILPLLFLISLAANAQLMIPLFEVPQKVEELSDNAEEQTPITFKDGEGMFFNRFYEKVNEDGGIIKAQDVWYATNGKKSWNNPYRAFRDTDGREIQILIGCTRDGERLYLLNRYFEKDSIMHRIVYKTRSGKHTWKDPVEVKIPGIDLSDQQTTLFMHSDEDVLLVSMLSKDTSSTPNEDLYLTYKKEDRTWSDLLDLGPNINTKGLEFSPFLTHDKKALYFASNGHEGFGESDIFVSYREEGRWDKWSRPLNLGLPINSSAFESSFVISDTNQVYFSSDRESSNTDMYFTKATGKTKMANLGVLAGQLFKDGKPVNAAKLSAYDLRNEFLESVETDGEGKFVFKKLVPDDMYEIKLDEAVEEDLGGSKLYLVDETGKLRKRIVFDANGEMAELASSGQELEGIFLQDGSSLLNTAIVIQDENGFPIDTVYTNEVGKFKYEKLAVDTDVFFTPRDISEEEPNLDLYTLDENGNRKTTYIGDKADVYKVFGKFAYKGLPLDNISLAVLDDNGLPLDTILTDAEGNFDYNRLSADQVYFSPIGEYDTGDLVLFRMDKNGKVFKKLAYDSDTGMFTEELDDYITLVDLQAKAKEEQKAKKEVTSSSSTSSTSESKVESLDKMNLNFGFNQAFLGSDNASKLSKTIAILKAQENVNIIITGHADNVGSDEVNKKVAMKRAMSVKNYLVKKGIDAKRISVASEGESKPIASNDTEEGRAKNRRTEISFE